MSKKIKKSISKSNKLKIKLKKGDLVKVMVGKDKGKTGNIDKVLVKQARVLVNGVNLYKKHVKPQGKDKPGGIIEMTRPLPVANVSLVCKKCNQVTRVGYLIDKSNKKHRICKKCQQVN